LTFKEARIRKPSKKGKGIQGIFSPGLLLPLKAFTMKTSIWYIIILLHIIILCANISSKHLNQKNLYDLTCRYTLPFFPQEWEMFAPPPTSNTRLYFRFVVYDDGVADTTSFREVLRPLYRHQVEDFYSLSRLSYYLYNCSQNMYLNYEYCINHMPDSIRHCGKAEMSQFINQKLATSYSHKALLKYGRQVFIKEYDHLESDSVSMSYHLLDVEIPSFENRYLVFDDGDDSKKIAVWNSSLYKIY
jgi:hypothetical protein